MMRLLNIGVGALAVALLMGMSAPAQAVDVNQRRNREMGVCRLEFSVTGQRIELGDRRDRETNMSLFEAGCPWLRTQLHPPNVCPIDFIYSQAGREPREGGPATWLCLLQSSIFPGWEASRKQSRACNSPRRG